MRTALRRDLTSPPTWTSARNTWRRTPAQQVLALSPDIWAPARAAQMVRLVQPWARIGKQCAGRRPPQGGVGHSRRTRRQESTIAHAIDVDEGPIEQIMACQTGRSRWLRGACSLSGPAGPGSLSPNYLRTSIASCSSHFSYRAFHFQPEEFPSCAFPALAR